MNNLDKIITEEGERRYLQFIGPQRGKVWNTKHIDQRQGWMECWTFIKDKILLLDSNNQPISARIVTDGDMDKEQYLAVTEMVKLAHEQANPTNRALKILNEYNNHKKEPWQDIQIPEEEITTHRVGNSVELWHTSTHSIATSVRYATEEDNYKAAMAKLKKSVWESKQAELTAYNNANEVLGRGDEEETTTSTAKKKHWNNLNIPLIDQELTYYNRPDQEKVGVQLTHLPTKYTVRCHKYTSKEQNYAECLQEIRFTLSLDKQALDDIEKNRD